MYTLFNEPSGNTKRLRFSSFETIKKLHQSNLNEVIDYYRSSDFATRSNHLLVQLIQSLPINLHQELYLYRDKVEDYTDEITRAFKLTSSTNVGRTFFPGVFFGVNSEEIIVVNNWDFDLSKVKHNWMDLSPIRFIRHPKTDFNLPLPNGQSVGNESGPSVILLNLAMLACQYREWRLREAIINPDYQRTTMQFIATFVIPNSLSSFLEVAYLNTVMRVFEMDYPKDSGYKHPFRISDVREKTIEGIEKIIAFNQKRKRSMMELLEINDGINANTLREVIALPQFVQTRQVTPALIIARLPLITFLVKWQNSTKSHASRKEYNVIARSVKKAIGDRSLSTIGTSNLTDEVLEHIHTRLLPFIK